MEVPEEYLEILAEHAEDDKRRGVWDMCQFWISCGLVLAGVGVTWFYGYPHGILAGMGVCFLNGVKLYKEWEALCRA